MGGWPQTITSNKWKGPKAAAISGCQQWGTRAHPVVLKFLPAFLFHSGVFLLLTVRLILRLLLFILAMMAGVRLKEQSPLHSITCSGKGFWGLEPTEDSLLELFIHSSCHWSGNGAAPAGNDSTGTSGCKEHSWFVSRCFTLQRCEKSTRKDPSSFISQQCLWTLPSLVWKLRQVLDYWVPTV